MFVTYKDVDRDSNVECYEIGADYIAVKFYGNQRVYVYSYKLAGVSNVETMKHLAESGDGLNAYINTNCKYLYDR